MLTVPDSLRDTLNRHNQSHVLGWWDSLDDAGRAGLLAQLEGLNLEELARLYAKRGQAEGLPGPERIGPVPVIPRHGPDDAARRAEGEASLRRGEVAVLLVAGGQGSRLGFEHPKGMYPVGPVSQKTLFQVHADKVRALSRRHGRPVPFLIMTSPATHDETVAHFAGRGNYGLAGDQVFFFQQGTMPSLDLATGRLILEAPGRLFLGPDGHGGTLTALATSGLLAAMKARGVKQFFYFQVDNPLLAVADPLFLGHHLHAGAEVSSKVIAKTGPKERMGVFATVDGRCAIIEYSDLPDELAHQTEPSGRLRFWAGSPAIHLFALDFLERVTGQADALPFHIARKKVPFLGSDGRLVQPTTENALKFERFIFDVLPLADRWTVVESLREEEFAPLKNADGADSPATVHAALVAQAADWLRRAGVKVDPGAAVEISPLFALDAEEVAAKVPPDATVPDGTFFE